MSDTLPRPLVIAHRGASWDRPENTLPAFERAIEVGADFVEFDVHADRDGRLVVTHDPEMLSGADQIHTMRDGRLDELG